MQATARAARAIPPGIGSGAEQSSSLAQANSALAKENADLRRANAELEQFTWTAAHDLKEPLRMVTSWLDLLDQRCSVQLADEAQEFLRCAMQGAVRMRGLIDDLLDFARLGTSTPTLERVNSEIAVTAALANLDPAIRESGAEIECAVLPDILVDLGLLTLV